MDKRKREEAPIRVYGTTWNAKIGTAIFVCFFVIGIALVREWGGLGLKYTWPLFAVLAIYVSIMFIINGTQQHLAIYPSGLEHRLGTCLYYVSWESLSHFDTINGLPCIVTEQRTEFQEAKFGFERYFYTQAVGNFIRLPMECGIASHFVQGKEFAQVNVEKLLKTDFGRDLLYYAPQLFKDSKDETQKNQ